MYLLHFKTPFKHAGHYCGYSGHGVVNRIVAHFEKRGANLMKFVIASGIEVEIALVRSGTRVDERKMKNNGGLRRLCPICRTGHRERNRSTAIVATLVKKRLKK